MKKLIQLIVFLVVILGLSNSVFGQAQSIKADFQVSQTGGLGYSIPIELPSYVLNHFPDLALTYNSQASDGIAGWGWSLSGLSSISRVSNTEYHDGYTSEISFGINDKYALDGQRFSIISSTNDLGFLVYPDYHEDGTTYNTEQLSNLKIQGFGNETVTTNCWVPGCPSTTYETGPQYFEISNPNGMKSWYGNHPSEDLNAKSNMEWAVSKIEDAQGNYVNYNYTLVDSTLRIDSIEDPEAKVKVMFEYGEKDYVNPIGIGGTLITNNRLLTDIYVYVNNTTLYYHYDLNFSKTSNNVDRIDSIDLINRDGESLPSINFDYAEADSGDIEVTDSDMSITVGDRNAAVFLSADFSGNGQMSFLNYGIDRDDDYNDVRIINKFSYGGYTGYLPETILGLENFENLFVSKYIESDGSLSSGDGVIVQRQIEGTSRFEFQVNSVGVGVLGTTVLDNKYVKYWDAPTSNNVIENLGSVEVDYDIGPYSEEKTILGNDINGSASVYGSPSWVSFIAQDEVVLSDGFQVSSGTTFIASIDENEVYTDNGLYDFRYVSGDFTGDGISDIVALAQKNDYEADVYLIDMDPTHESTDNYSKSLGTIILSSTTNLNIADFDGDGKSELVTSTNEGDIRIHSFKSSYRLVVNYDIWGSGQGSTDFVYSDLTREYFGRPFTGNTSEDYSFLIGDFNGDGKSDMARSSAHGSETWQFLINKGGYSFEYLTKDINLSFSKTEVKAKQFTPPANGDCSGDAIFSNCYYSSALYQYNYIPIDYNKDGKTDIIKQSITEPYYTNSTGVSTHKIQYATNNSTHVDFLSFANETIYDGENIGDPKNGHLLYSNGFNSTYKNQLAYVHASGFVNSFEYTGDVAAEFRLESTTNNALTQEYTYSSLINGSNYTAEFNDVYEFPYVEMRNAPDLKIITNVEETFSGFTRNKKYKYANLISATDGRGLLGFQYLGKSNWVASDVAESWSISEFDLKNKYLKSTTNIMSSITNSDDLLTDYSDYLSKTNYSYQTRTSTYGTYINLATQITSEDKLRGVTTTTTNEFDEYYNITETKQTYQGGSETVTATYDTNVNGEGADYYTGRPLTKTTTKTLGNETFSTAEVFTYENNLIKTLQTKGNNTPWLTETYDYDSFGNIITKSLSASGIEDRTSSSIYDSETGRFLEKIIDVEGFETNYDYDKNLGLLNSETDHFGKTQSFTYDGWNRLKTQTDYLGSIITTTYTNSSSTGSLNTLTNNSISSLNDTYTTVNRAGWVTYKRSRDQLGQTVRVTTEYDAIGRKKRESKPYISSASLWNNYYYDEYNRPSSTVSYTGQTITTSYDGLTVTVDNGVKTMSSTQDAVGNKISITDPGGTINYSYYANNAPKETTYDTHKITTKIDGWGRKTELNDPAAGVYSYTYNILGEVLTESTPNGITTYTYDDYGKVATKAIVGDNTDLFLDYTYNPTTSQIGLIDAQDNINGYDYTYDYAYDDYQRPINITEITPFATFTKTISYDDANGGRPDVQTITTTSSLSTDSSLVSIENQYNSSSGKLSGIKDTSTNTILWEAKAVNDDGNFTEIALGNGITKNNTYDAYGMPEQFTHANDNVTALDIDFSFDAQRGNLSSRHNKAFTGEEAFTYDSLDRLTEISGAVTHTQSYHDNGNINDNSNVGIYNYDPTTMYRVAGIDLNGLGETYYETHTPQQITYNAFKKPVNIKEGDNAQVDFVYGPLMNRSVAYYGGNATNKEDREHTKVYSAIAPVELIVNNSTNTSKIITYTMGDGYTAPIAHITEDGTDEFTYLHRDHLGSILAITNSSGAILEQTHYGAWGKVAQFSSTVTSANTLDYTSLLGRGYTGHEHFASVGLIHMNGRMYDANLGRFLSPDNYIQDPFNTQSFNRYGYVWNNPLKFSDPTGEFLVTAIVIGAVIGATSAAIQGGSITDILKGALIGGIAGLVSGGVANLVGGAAFFSTQALTITGGFAGGFTAGFASGFAGGFTGGALNSWANGGSVLDGITAGVKGGMIGGMLGGLTQGVMAGVKASKGGLDFWTASKLSKKSIAFVKSSGYSPDGAIEATDVNLIKARDAWIPDAPMDNVKAFTTENVPMKMQNLMNSENAAGATRALGKNGIYTGKSNVYFNKTAFTSAKELYYTMVHEFNHVSQHALLKGVSAASINTEFFSQIKEYAAYSHTARLGSTNYGGFGPNGNLSSLVPDITSHPYFTKFHYSNYAWTKTINFSDIKF